MSAFLIPLGILLLGFVIGVVVASVVLSGIMYFTFILVPKIREMANPTEPKV